MSELQDIEVVYLGPCTVNSGKSGWIFILPSALDGLTSAEAIRREASAYQRKGKKTFTVGAIYKARGIVNGNEITSLSLVSLRYDRACDHPVIPVFEAQAWEDADKAKRDAAERKLKENSLAQRQMKHTIEWLKKFPLRERRKLADALYSQILDEIYR